MGAPVLAAAIGFLSGVLSGAFGIGGGVVTTPAIRLLMDAPALIAVGTPLPVIIPAAVTGALTYRRQGKLDARAALMLAVAGSATAVAGALIAARVGGTWVLLGTALLIFWAAADTVLQVMRPPAVIPGEQDARAAVLPLVAVGALTGLYSGFFGLGGGFVLVPLLTRWLRFDLKRAIGTSLATVALLAVPGTITHALLGHIDWVIASGLVVGVIPGALVGARVSLGAHDRHIRIGFAILLVVVGLWLASSELGEVFVG